MDEVLRMELPVEYPLPKKIVSGVEMVNRILSARRRFLSERTCGDRETQEIKNNFPFPQSLSERTLRWMRLVDRN